MSFTELWFWILVAQLAAAAVAGWSLAFLMTRLSIRLAFRFDIVARPNQRTSHEGVVPRIGGVGVAGAFLAAWIAAGVWMWISRSRGGGGEAAAEEPWPLALPFFWSALIGGAGAFFLGLWDDVRSLSAPVKLVVQLILSAVPPLLGLRLMRVGLPGMGPWPVPALLGLAAAFVWVLFWMNAYNFMDGIDGIAGRFGEYLSLALLIMMIGVRPVEALLLAFLAGACFGFLVWNYPQARTFLGDCGSQFLGYLFAVWTLHLAGEFVPVRAVVPAMIALTLPFSWDVTYTLIRRAIRGENVLKAHRSHLYQRLTSTGLNHAETLALCEKTFIACAVASLFVVRFSTAGNVAFQWGSLAVSILAMVVFTRYVRHREGVVEKASADSGHPPPAQDGSIK